MLKVTTLSLIALLCALLVFYVLFAAVRKAFVQLLDQANLGYQLLSEHSNLAPKERNRWQQLLLQRAAWFDAAGNPKAAAQDRSAAKAISRKAQARRASE